MDADANINSTQSAYANVNAEVSSAASVDANIKFLRIIRGCGCKYSLHLYSGPLSLCSVWWLVCLGSFLAC